MWLCLASFFGTLAVTLWAQLCHVGLGALEVIAAGFVAVSSVAMVVAKRRGWVHGQLLLITAALCGVLGIWTLQALSGWDVRALGNDTVPMSVVMGAIIILCMVGLWGHRVWARWLAWAGAGAGLLANGLNGIGSLFHPSLWTWGHALNVACCLLLIAGTTGPAVRAVFEDGAHTNPLWRSSDLLIRALRWTVVANLVAAPMLLVYAWVQPVVPATVPTAIALCVALGLAVGLTVARTVGGAVLLTLCGAALLAQTVATFVGAAAQQREVIRIVGYYACFWLPAGALSLATGLILVTRVARSLTRWR